MKHFKFSKSSLAKLDTMEPDLREVFKLALNYSKFDFGISEGIRDLDTQKKYLAAGKTTTLKSKHLPNSEGKSEAGDIFILDKNGSVTWEFKYYRKVAEAMFRAAFELNVPIAWGGHWYSFSDGPHFELLQILD